MPPIPTVAATNVKMSSLVIVNSNIILIKGDSFNGQDIQTMDLSYNQINYINVQAFRGLEVSVTQSCSLMIYSSFMRFFQNKLYQLTLNHNLLSSIPAMSLGNLHQLHYLYLQNNRIHQIEHGIFRVSLSAMWMMTLSCHFVLFSGNSFEEATVPSSGQQSHQQRA